MRNSSPIKRCTCGYCKTKYMSRKEKRHAWKKLRMATRMAIYYGNPPIEKVSTGWRD